MPPYQPVTPVLQTGNGQNFLTWPLVVGATSYSVQRSIDGSTFSTLATTPTLSYLDNTALVGVNYYYQVAASNTNGSSAYTPSYPTSITPCLPGQITLGYLRYLTQLRSDKLNSQYLTTDEWNSNINQSVYDLYDMLVLNYGDNYFFAPPLLVNLTGQNSYPVPDGSNYPVNGVNSPACYKLNGIDLNISGQTSTQNAGWIPLSRANWSDRDRYTIFPGNTGPLFYGAIQMSYAEMGNQIYVFPPNANATIRVWYVPIMTQLLQDTDMLSFSLSGWSEWVINDAAMKAMVKEESLEKWNALSAANQRIEARIQDAAKNRDVGQPPTVSNTRQTMGDPGFGGWGNGTGSFGGFGTGGY